MSQISWKFHIYENSKNFETIPTKNLYPVVQNIKNLSCRVKLFSWKCFKILGTFIYMESADWVLDPSIFFPTLSTFQVNQSWSVINQSWSMVNRHLQVSIYIDQSRLMLINLDHMILLIDRSLMLIHWPINRLLFSCIIWSILININQDWSTYWSTWRCQSQPLTNFD